MELTPCPPAGRVPIGATDDDPPPPGAEVFAVRGGEPPGEEVDVRLDCWAVASKRLKPWDWALETGEEVLFARERWCCCCWVFGDGPLPPAVACCCCSGSGPLNWLCRSVEFICVEPLANGSLLRGDGPCPLKALLGRGVWLSSAKLPSPTYGEVLLP